MAKLTRFFGLHITRTAGTALSDLAVAALGRSECLLVSSFAQLELDHEVTPQERMAKPLPLFSFGHYVHESLWRCLEIAGKVHAFTVYRDPGDRIRSEVRHMHQVGIDAEIIREQLLRYPNPWCLEIIRCFPTAARVAAGQPLHRQALLALSLLDEAVPMDRVDVLAERLLGFWDVPIRPQVRSMNASPVEPPDLGFDPASPEHIREDSLLHIALSDRSDWRMDVKELREALIARYPNDTEARQEFLCHLDLYMTSELRAMARLDLHRKSMSARLKELQRLVAALPAE